MGAAERSIRTRNALLDAAKAIFAESGYARTSHADIAAEADIGRTTFYEHFSSKEDLLVQLVERDLPALIDQIVASVDPDLPPDVHLRELTTRFVEFIGTDQLGIILHTETPRLSLEAQAAIAATHRGLTGEFMSIYRRGVADGVFVEIHPQLVGRLMQETMMTGGRVLIGLDDPKQHVHCLAEATASFLVNGLTRQQA
jgi:AcrR family transcriptional regulator